MQTAVTSCEGAEAQLSKLLCCVSFRHFASASKHLAYNPHRGSTILCLVTRRVAPAVSVLPQTALTTGNRHSPALVNRRLRLQRMPIKKPSLHVVKVH